jgi:hypothetical protein
MGRHQQALACHDRESRLQRGRRRRQAAGSR